MNQNLPPPVAIFRLITGYYVSRAIHVVAKLGIADLLASGPQAVDDLASKTGTDRPSLFRLLRALASLGVFAEEPGQCFRLTPAAEPLRRDVPGSQWAMAVMMSSAMTYQWGLSGLFWFVVPNGFAVIAIFALAWGGSALLYRWKGAGSGA